MCEWLKSKGGIAWASERAEQWASSLYDIIDKSCLYKNSIDPNYRSRINIPFQFENEELRATVLN